MTVIPAPKPIELRTHLGSARTELVRGFIREAALAEGASAVCAHELASDGAEAWLLLSAAATGDEPASLAVSVAHREVRARILLHGHARFAHLVASLAGRLRPGAGISGHDSGIDNCELILHRSIDAAEERHAIMHTPTDQGNPSAIAEGVQFGLAEKADTASIARCFLEVYGHHYIHTDVYRPQRYWKRVENRELVPVVARDKSGAVIGHLALERESGAVVAERGEAVVLPAYRGHHLLESMSARLSEEAAKQGLAGIYSEALTIHTFSQRNDDRSGFAICAALLGANPESFRPMDVDCPTAGQRQSYLRTFRFVETPAPRRLQFAGPYQDVILKIYDSLGVPVTAADAVDAAGEASMTRIRVNDRGYGAIRFERIGSNCAVELAQALRDIRSLGGASVQLQARVSDPGLSSLIAAARPLGFFFCGLGPAFADGEDLLLLQYLSEPLDTNKLQIYTAAARELIGFIDEDRLATGGKMPAAH